MSRNRIKNSQSLHWMGVVKWILIVGLVSLLGLSYMLCKNQNLHIAEETHRLQLQLDSIQARNEGLILDLERMQSPAALQRRLGQMHSTLVSILRLPQVQFDEKTKVRLARTGTTPQSTLNFNPAVVSADPVIAPTQR